MSSRSDQSASGGGTSRKERRAAERSARKGGGPVVTTTTRVLRPLDDGHHGGRRRHRPPRGPRARRRQRRASGTTRSQPSPSRTRPRPRPSCAQGRSLGDPDAPVKIEVFEDPQCPACGRYTERIEPLLIAGPVTDGTVFLTYRDFPFLGQESLDAAVAMRVAEDLDGKFWDYHAARLPQPARREPGRLHPSSAWPTWPSWWASTARRSWRPWTIPQFRRRPRPRPPRAPSSA